MGIAMDNCEKIRSELVAYLDGELSSADADSVRRHLETCVHCQEETKLLADVAESLSRLPVLKPRADYLGRLQAGIYRRERRIWITRAAVLAPLAAMLLWALLWPPGQMVETVPPEASEIVENLELLSNLDCLENLPVLEDMEELELLALLSEIEEPGGS